VLHLFESEFQWSLLWFKLMLCVVTSFVENAQRTEKVFLLMIGFTNSSLKQKSFLKLKFGAFQNVENFSYLDAEVLLQSTRSISSYAFYEGIKHDSADQFVTVGSRITYSFALRHSLKKLRIYLFVNTKPNLGTKKALQLSSCLTALLRIFWVRKNPWLPAANLPHFVRSS